MNKTKIQWTDRHGMSEVCTKKEFLRDVAEHRMKVLRDDGVYRHLEFRGESGWHHWFEIVTWPMGLCIRGDMGTWTFSRLTDMFEFFRPSTGELSINKSYWREKLLHGNKSGYDAAKVFSMDALRRQVFDHLDNWDLSEDEKESVKADLEEEVLGFCDYEKHEALTALYGFRNLLGVQFDPTDGPFGDDWSYHYVWCCWAIVWAIQQYDKEGAKK